MTILNLNKPAEPNALDPCAAAEAELEQEKQTLTNDSAERRRREASKAQATAARERAHTALSRIIGDPMTFATTPADELESAKRALIGAAEVEASAAAALAAHVAQTGDLEERGKALGRKSALLAQARARADYEALQTRKVKAGLEFEAIEAEERAWLARAYGDWPEANGELQQGAGLPVLLFPAGIFMKTAPLAGHRLKSIFESDYLTLAVACYPHLAELLPADRAEAIRAEINAIYERGTWSFPGKAPWHFSETFGATGVKLANGNIRRELRDL